MSMTEEDKKPIRDEARGEGFSDGVDAGRKLADEIDAIIYTRQTDIFYGGVYFDEYVKAFIEGLTRTFKRRADDHAATRADIRRDKQRRAKKEGA